MFVQIITAPVRDAQGVRRLGERWLDEVAPGAAGWLGATAGVTDEGVFLLSARFASTEDARRNNDRAEQQAWWEELVKHLDAAPEVVSSSDTLLWRGEGCDDAGFVQVVRGRAVDRRALESLLEVFDDDAQVRAEILGNLFVWHPDGEHFTEVVYFTSEDDARVGEAAPLDDDAEAMMARWDEVTADLGYLDLPDPWLSAP